MNVKRRALTPKNELMNVKFFSLPQDVQLKCLGLTEEVTQTSRFKNMDIKDVIKQVWNGKYNSVKRRILKSMTIRYGKNIPNVEFQKGTAEWIGLQ